MPTLPGTHSYITLTGKYLRQDGNPCAGTVTFTLTNPLVETTDHFFLRAATQSATLDVNGAVSQSLLCTDDSTLTPSGYQYQVTETIDAQSSTYFISLPHTLGSTVDLSTLSPGSNAPAITTYELASAHATDVAALGYAQARRSGYALWNRDLNLGNWSNSTAFMKTNVWTAGVVHLNRIPVPLAISGLAGVLSFAWRAATGTGGLNAFIGIYTLASGTLTRQYVSADLATITYGNPNTLTGITALSGSLPADTPTTALYAALLIGTQDSTGMGPIFDNSPGQHGGQRIAGFGGEPSEALSYGSGLSALPATISYSATATYNGYGLTWWGVS